MKKNMLFYILILLVFAVVPTINVRAANEVRARYGTVLCPTEDKYYKWGHMDTCDISKTTPLNEIFVFEADANKGVIVSSYRTYNYKEKFGIIEPEMKNGAVSYDEFGKDKINCSGGRFEIDNGAVKIDYSSIINYYNNNNSFPQYITINLTSGKVYAGDLDKEYVKNNNNSIATSYDDYILLAKNSDFPYACLGYDNVINNIKDLENGSDAQDNAIKFGEERCDMIKKGLNKNPDSLCYAKCVKYKDDVAKANPEYFNNVNKCGLGEDMVGWLLRILKIIRYILPVIVIALSLSEYIGAIAASNDDAMKKAGKRFSARLLVLIIIFLIPSILQLIFNIFHIDGLDSSNPYCLK